MLVRGEAALESTISTINVSPKPEPYALGMRREQRKRTVSGMGVGWRVGGRGSEMLAQFLPFGEAQLTCGYGNLTGNLTHSGGSPFVAA